MKQSRIEECKQDLALIREKRSVRRKPRDPEELRLLIQHALLRKEKALASKEYERLGPRRWRLNAIQSTDLE